MLERQEPTSNHVQQTQNTLWVTVAGKETDFKENDLELDPAIMYDCGIRFNSLVGLQIHKARWCKNVILLLENINWIMTLWIWTAPTAFSIPLLSDSAPEKFYQAKNPVSQRQPESYLDKSSPKILIYPYNPS